MTWLVALIAVVMGSIVFVRWMELRMQQEGEATEKVWRRLEMLEDTQRQLLRRIEHLEAIVVSETWEALRDKPRSAEEISSSLSGTNAGKVAEIARRLEQRGSDG